MPDKPCSILQPFVQFFQRKRKLYYFFRLLPRFSIDLGIVVEDSNGSWWRLIHQKTGNTRNDVWIWNEGRNSYNLNKKVDWIKNHNYWNEVREGYLTKKNMYLTRNDYNHPSFICYIEAVNEVYDRYNHGKKS